MKTMALCVIVSIALIGTALGGQLSRIELTDGSVIEAEVISLNNGIYSLSSGALGQINVPASKIRRIEIASSGPRVAAPATPAAPYASGPAQSAQNPPNNEFKAKMDSMASSMAANPDAMNSVASLAADPTFQDLLNDPDIVAKVQGGDIQSLMNNPKFMNAIKNPKIKEIHDKISQ